MTGLCGKYNISGMIRKWLEWSRISAVCGSFSCSNDTRGYYKLDMIFICNWYTFVKLSVITGMHIFSWCIQLIIIIITLFVNLFSKCIHKATTQRTITTREVLKKGQKLDKQAAGLLFLCSILLKLGNKRQLITESVLADDTCQTRDPVFTINEVS